MRILERGCLVELTGQCNGRVGAFVQPSETACVRNHPVRPSSCADIQVLIVHVALYRLTQPRGDEGCLKYLLFAVHVEDCARDASLVYSLCVITVDDAGVLSTVLCMRNTRGFTLLELVITLVIAAVLFGIGAFSYEFLNRATDSAEAVSRLDRTAVAEQAVARDFGFYSPYASDLTAVGSDVTIVENGDTVSLISTSNEVSVAVSSEGDLGLATNSPDGCLGRFVVNLNYGGAATEVDLSSSACSGLAVLQTQDPDVTLTTYTPGGSAWQD